MIRALALLALCLTLAGCATTRTTPQATLADVQRGITPWDQPAEIKLYTVKSARTDGGAHTAMLISGSQRALWDPAGSFVHPNVPERGDLLYGFTPLIQKVYIDYHVRPTYYMYEQTLPVTREQADAMIRLASQNGRASRSTCARTTSRILSQAGIDVSRTWFPDRLQRQLAEIPGVGMGRRIDETNVDTNHNVIFGKGGVPVPPGG